MKRPRYRDKDRIGSGGGGEVFRATLGWFGRPVAVKKLSTEQSKDAQLAARLRREAATLAALDHEHIVQFEGVSADRKGRIELVMEYVDGMTVSELVEGGPLPVGAAVYVTRCVLDALAYGHAQNLVHRDVSARNVLVSWDGAIKLTDYGLVKPIGAKPTTGMGLGGTLPYLAPEQAHGLGLDGRADLFAVGALLYKMVTGRVPFDGKTERETLASLLSGLPPSWDAVPASLIPVVGKLLASERAARYQSAEDAIADLPGADDPAVVRDDLVVLLRVRGGRDGSPPRRLAQAAMVVGGLTLAGLGAAGMYTWVDGGDQARSNQSAEQSSIAPDIETSENATPLTETPNSERHEHEEPSAQSESERAQTTEAAAGPGDERPVKRTADAAHPVVSPGKVRHARRSRREAPSTGESSAQSRDNQRREGSISSGSEKSLPSAVANQGEPVNGMGVDNRHMSTRGDRMSTLEGREATGVTYDGLARPMGGVRDLGHLENEGDSRE